jgi:hypothetical protein
MLLLLLQQQQQLLQQQLQLHKQQAGWCFMEEFPCMLYLQYVDGYIEPVP